MNKREKKRFQHIASHHLSRLSRKNDETEFQEMNFFHVNASALRSIEIQLANKQNYLFKLPRPTIATEIKRLRELGFAMNEKSLLSSFIIKLQVSFFLSPFAAGVNKCSTLMQTARSSDQLKTVIIERELPTAFAHKNSERICFGNFFFSSVASAVQIPPRKTYLMKM